MARKGSPKMMAGKKDATVLLRMSKAMREALQKLADADNRKMADYCRLVLLQHVESRKGGR